MVSSPSPPIKLSAPIRKKETATPTLPSWKTIRGTDIRRDCTCFVRYKMMDLPDPGLSYTLSEGADGTVIQIRAQNFAKFVELELKDGDSLFSDNYFDMDAGEVRKISIKRDVPLPLSIDNLQIRSLYNSY